MPRNRALTPSNVARHVPNDGVAEILLDEARVAAFHRTRVTACVTQSVRVSVLDSGAVGNGPQQLAEAIARASGPICVGCTAVRAYVAVRRAATFARFNVASLSRAKL
jgi:hypothetical protein